jgi:hypothetical protein
VLREVADKVDGAPLRFGDDDRVQILGAGEHVEAEHVRSRRGELAQQRRHLFRVDAELLRPTPLFWSQR